MLNNRKYINEIAKRNEELVELTKYYVRKCNFYKKENKNLKVDVESKENTIINVLDSNKELSLANTSLENKINTLEEVIRKHEENECELNTKLCRAEGKLDKIENMTRMLGGDINA